MYYATRAQGEADLVIRPHAMGQANLHIGPATLARPPASLIFLVLIC